MTAVTISLLSSTQLWKKSLIEDASPEYVWQQLAPPGSGTHQHEWKEGTYPSAIVPVNAFDEKLWMIGRKRAWSSNDGIRWDVFDKHDWGERISMNTVFFKGTLLISGGMDYSSGRFLKAWTTQHGNLGKVRRLLNSTAGFGSLAARQVLMNTRLPISLSTTYGHLMMA
jgi:hypothetical protein